MFEQHVEAFGYRLIAAVDERDVVLQIADGHAGQPHSGEEDESAHRFGMVATVAAAVAVDLDEAGTFVVTQRVRGDVE